MSLARTPSGKRRSAKDLRKPDVMIQALAPFYERALGAFSLAQRMQILERTDMLRMLDVCDYIRLTRNTVREYVKQGRIICLEKPVNYFSFPKWQFDIPAVRMVAIREFSVACKTTDGWTQLHWFETPLPQLDNRSPRELLEEEEDDGFESVLAVLHSGFVMRKPPSPLPLPGLHSKKTIRSLASPLTPGTVKTTWVLNYKPEFVLC